MDLFAPGELHEQRAPRNPNRPDGVAHIYPWALAHRLQHKAGKRWRPANGTEGELFAETVCVNCTKWDEGECEISLRMMTFGIDERAYPYEMQISDAGQPRCTAFKEATP